MRAPPRPTPGPTPGAPGAPAAAKAHWVWDVHAFPVAHGVASQANTVWHTLAWATAHPAVVGVVASEPGDYVELTGLRAPTGRLRPAVGALRRALRGLSEAAVP
jgi:hypothetical protein